MGRLQTADYRRTLQQKVGLIVCHNWRSCSGNKPPLTTTAEEKYFRKVEYDYAKVEDYSRQQASVVHDFEESKSARIPLLERTAFPSQWVGLKDEEIQELI
jgi:hypothetical protein